MGPDGIEPSTSPLSGVRSSHLSYGPLAFTGGAGRDRTGDLLNANQALSQLSYSPKLLDAGEPFRILPILNSIEASWMQGLEETSPLPLGKNLQNFKWR